MQTVSETGSRHSPILPTWLDSLFTVDARLEEKPAGFSVDGDLRKAGKKAVSQEAGFAPKDGFFVKPGGHVLKFLGADLNHGLGLWNGKLREANGGFSTAILGAAL